MSLNDLLESRYEAYRQKYGRAPQVIRLLPGTFALFLITFQVERDEMDSITWNYIPVIKDETIADRVVMEPTD